MFICTDVFALVWMDGWMNGVWCVAKDALILVRRLLFDLVPMMRSGGDGKHEKERKKGIFLLSG